MVAADARAAFLIGDLDEVRTFVRQIGRWLSMRDVKLIVIACNTASAAALKHLRALHPDFPFVGMEPAVKPAAEQTLSGKVGVLATPSTFQGEMYASVVERFAKDVRFFRLPALGWLGKLKKAT